VRPGRDDVLDELDITAEVGHEHVDDGVGRDVLHGLDHAVPVVRALVRELVAVHARDDRIAERELLHGVRDLRGLEDIQRRGGHLELGARLHVAEAAAARARVAHDHERRLALRPALSAIRTTRLLAHGVEAVRLEERLDLRDLRAHRKRAHEPARLRQVGLADHVLRWRAHASPEAGSSHERCAGPRVRARFARRYWSNHANQMDHVLAWFAWFAWSRAREARCSRALPG
jgi:hypothetical protein